MQHDEMIWQVINNQFCSYKTTIGKAKSDKTHFCRHPYSVTGLCNRTSCPLANSKYATIREENGRIYLYMKTAERAHSPKNLWEKVLLSRNYSKALEQLDENLQYQFNKTLIHRNKQRLTKIHQYLIRMRKIKVKRLAGGKAKYVRVHRKVEQREIRRERKALVAANLEKNIEKQLVERLAKGTYGDIYNFPEAPYQKALQRMKKKQQLEEEEDGEKATEEDEEGEDDSEAEETEEETDEEEEEEMDGVVEYVEDLEESDEELEEDIEDMEYLGGGKWGSSEDDDEEEEEDSDDDDSDDSDDSDDDDDSEEDSEEDDDQKKKKRNKPKKKPTPPPARQRGPRIEIEYEEETEQDQTSIPQIAGEAW